MSGGPRRIGDSVIVLTGGSSGIGRATARTAASRGASIVLAARDGPALDDAADECRAAGGQALAVQTDVADEEAVGRLAQRAVERFGRIDVWVNNAAVMSYGRFEDTPADVYRHIVETNLFGQIHGARAVLPQFRAQGHGVLINVASLYAKLTSPYVGPYITSKFGVLGFSEVLRQELHDQPRISVCTVLPYSVDTPIFTHTANYTGRESRPIPPVVAPERVVDAILGCVEHPRAEVSVGRLGTAFAWAHLLAPGLYDWLVPRVMERVGFTSRRIEPTDGNVFAPQPERNRVSGDWRRRRARFLAKAGAGAAAAAIPAVLWRSSR